jgi:uncharacterized membrane protein YciS (DUF1049 family)
MSKEYILRFIGIGMYRRFLQFIFLLAILGIAVTLVATISNNVHEVNPTDLQAPTNYALSTETKTVYGAPLPYLSYIIGVATWWPLIVPGSSPPLTIIISRYDFLWFNFAIDFLLYASIIFLMYVIIKYVRFQRMHNHETRPID